MSHLLPALPCDLVLIGTPLDLGKPRDIGKPMLRVQYELDEASAGLLEEEVEAVLLCSPEHFRVMDVKNLCRQPGFPGSGRQGTGRVRPFPHEVPLAAAGGAGVRRLVRSARLPDRTTGLPRGLRGGEATPSGTRAVG